MSILTCFTLYMMSLQGNANQYSQHTQSSLRGKLSTCKAMSRLFETEWNHNMIGTGQLIPLIFHLFHKKIYFQKKYRHNNLNLHRNNFQIVPHFYITLLLHNYSLWNKFVKMVYWCLIFAFLCTTFFLFFIVWMFSLIFSFFYVFLLS